MVKVYFESSSHAELVAVFDDEQLYMDCVHILESVASERNMILTEFIDNKLDLDNIIH